MKRLALWAGLLLVAGAPAAGADPQPMQILERCDAAFDAVQDYTVTFVKHQRVRERLRKPETIFLKFKKPFAIYMKWVKNPDEGKEVIYVEGKNDGKLIAHPGGILNLVTPPLKLAPENPIAMGGNLKPITHAGLGHAIDSLLRVCREAAAKGDLSLAYRGTKEFEGAAVLVIERNLPDGKGYPNCRTIIFVDERLNLPVYYASYDAKNRLMEEYIYRDLKLNVGLTDIDFCPSNPEYAYNLF